MKITAGIGGDHPVSAIGTTHEKVKGRFLAVKYECYQKG